MALLKLEDVSKNYGNVGAVANLNLAVEKGEFVSLLGPSGCGKTTTLQMIAGFAEVSSGRIIMDGVDITNEKPNRRGLGIVFQSYALFPHMTVAENVEFGLEMRKIPAAERQDRVSRVLALVHLEQLGQRYPRELSGGQRQRVALARAIVIEPPVLLLDEPMSNLDAKLREDMQLELREIQKKVGITTIMVTHDQSEALSMSDRVVVMEAGRAVQIGKPFETYEFPANRFVSQFVGKANLLEGEVEDVDHAGAALRVGARLLKVAHEGNDSPRVGDRITVCLRPEKIFPCERQDELVRGKITTRFFQGNQWLYRIHSDIGELLAIWQNDGRAVYVEGDDISLRWHSESMRMIGQRNGKAVNER
jgi:putative spermidine/putrescine transport system ATP-binding protein